MIDIPLLNDYAGFIVLAFVVLYLIRGIINSRISRLDADLIDSLDAIASDLDRHSSLESAVKRVSELPNSAAPFFKKIINNSLQGMSFEDALNHARATSRSKTLSYICELLATAYRSKANVAPSLKELSKKLWQIQHLEQTISSKSSGPIMLLQILGVFLLPLIYYFLAALLNTDTLHTIDMVTSPMFTIYLFVICICMASLDFFIFGDLRETAWVLPVAVSYFYFAMIKAGPYLVQAMGGQFG